MWLLLTKITAFNCTYIDSLCLLYFQAANPECVLEDFVRWYSPRDWVEIGEEVVLDADTNEEKTVKKYGLSTRMNITGNVWIETWNNANPVPVRRQKRLFDDTKEAENVNIIFATAKNGITMYITYFKHFTKGFQLAQLVNSRSNHRKYTPRLILFGHIRML